MVAKIELLLALDLLIVVRGNQLALVAANGNCCVLYEGSFLRLSGRRVGAGESMRLLIVVDRIILEVEIHWHLLFKSTLSNFKVYEYQDKLKLELQQEFLIPVFLNFIFCEL